MQYWSSLSGKRIHLPMQETPVQSLSQEDILEEGMATQSSILAWRIPWTWRWAWWAIQFIGHRESDMTECAHTHTHTHAILVNNSDKNSMNISICSYISKCFSSLNYPWYRYHRISLLHFISEHRFICWDGVSLGSLRTEDSEGWEN